MVRHVARALNVKFYLNDDIKKTQQRLKSSFRQGMNPNEWGFFVEDVILSMMRFYSFELDFDDDDNLTFQPEGVKLFDKTSIDPVDCNCTLLRPRSWKYPYVDAVALVQNPPEIIGIQISFQRPRSKNSLKFFDADWVRFHDAMAKPQGQKKKKKKKKRKNPEPRRTLWWISKDESVLPDPVDGVSQFLWTFDEFQNMYGMGDIFPK